MCEHWWTAYKDHPITAKEVFEVAKVNCLLLSVWGGRSLLGAQQRIGHALADIRDRVFGGYRIRPASRDSVTKNLAYRIEQVTAKTPKTPVDTIAPTAEISGGSGVSGVSGVLQRPATVSLNYQNGAGHDDAPHVCECGETMPEGRKECFVCHRPRRT